MAEVYVAEADGWAWRIKRVWKIKPVNVYMFRAKRPDLAPGGGIKRQIKRQIKGLLYNSTTPKPT
jgi:hypothetical protein